MQICSSGRVHGLNDLLDDEDQQVIRVSCRPLKQRHLFAELVGLDRTLMEEAL
jgi:hypothetical protein